MNRFLNDPQVAPYAAHAGRETVKSAVNEMLEAARHDVRGVPSFDALRDALLLQLELQRTQGLVPLVNATGILLHTNLGRAPLAAAALDAVREIGTAYSNVEYDLAQGRRGSRYDRTGMLLRALTGAQDALVVNNCAAAVLLAVDTFARGREVIVSRGELVEIGGGFRVPDVLRRSGAHLVEVGTTNRTSAEDYRRALTANTALLLRTHASNFRQEGFVAQAPPAELAALAVKSGVPLLEDLGSGACVDLREYGLPYERTVQEALADGAGLVAFSADKLLGGPQAGIIAGRRTLVARMRSNALLRALRVDKLTLAALGATLRLYENPETRRAIPFYAMLEASVPELRARAQRYASIPGTRIVDTQAYAGGGSVPQAAIASAGVAIEAASADETAGRLRAGTPAVVARTHEGRLLLDLRTVLPEQDEAVVAALRAALEPQG